MEQRTDVSKEDRRPTFAEIYVRLSIDLSRRADCKRAQVGCVITDEHGTQVYGVGYNGGAAKDLCRCSGEQGNCGCIHAEANALIKCRTQDLHKIVYTTSSPCKTCAKLIVNSGCIAVYYIRKHRDFDESEKILWGAGVKSIPFELKMKDVMSSLNTVDYSILNYTHGSGKLFDAWQHLRSIFFTF